MDLEKQNEEQTDIQAALQMASETGPGRSNDGQPTEALSDTLTHATQGPCPFLAVRYTLTRCAWLAESAPWQTIAVVCLAIACGWVCVYFGATVLVGWVLYAIFASDAP